MLMRVDVCARAERSTAMDIAAIFDWFARESLQAAEETDPNDLEGRETFLKLAQLWAAAAKQSLDQASTVPAV